MSLKESIEKMVNLNGRVHESAKVVLRDIKKFKDLLKSLNNSKNGKAFDKIKNDAQKALEQVRQDLIKEQDDADAWEAQVKTAKTDLAKAKKDLKENREGYEFNLKKCQDLNKILKKYNETPQGKKKPEYLLPEIDPAVAMKDATRAVEDAELDIDFNEASLGVVQAQTKSDKKTLERRVSELFEKKFKSAK